MKNIANLSINNTYNRLFTYGLIIYNIVIMENTNNQINNQQPKSFFTKKKILMYLLCIVIFALIIFLVYKFVIDIDFNQLFHSFENNQTEQLFPLWLTFLILFPVYNVFLRIFPYAYKLRQRGIIVEWYNWLIFAFVTFFIGAITPFAMGAEPYIIYWLNKRGLKPKDATAIVASFTVINPFMQILITWPSFFYVCSMYGANSSNQAWIGCFWAVFVGLMFDLMGTTFWLIMSLSKRMHFLINYGINRVKKFFKLPNKSKEEIKQEYIDNAAFQKAFLKEMRDLKFVIALGCMSLLWNFFYYSALILAFNLLDPSYRLNPWDIFNFVNIATTANNFIPIPGAEGTIQGVIVVFIRTSKNIGDIGFAEDELKILADNSVFLWRFFTFYITAILGLVAFVVLICQEGYKIVIQSKRRKAGRVDKTFSIIVYLRGELDKLKLTLIYLINNRYDNNKVEIILANTNKKDELNDELNEIIKENNIKYVYKKGLSKDESIKYALDNDLVHNDYLNLIESNSLLNFSVLEAINNTYRNYDLHVTSFKQKTNKIKSFKTRKPYYQLFSRRFMNKTQMCAQNLELCNCFIRTEILKGYTSNKTLDDISKVGLLNYVINKSSKLRYHGHQAGFFYINSTQNDDLKVDKKIINDCINNDLQELLLTISPSNLEQITNGEKIELQRKFKFNMYPFYMQWIMVLKYNMKYKKLFQIQVNN